MRQRVVLTSLVLSALATAGCGAAAERTVRAASAATAAPSHPAAPSKGAAATETRAPGAASPAVRRPAGPAPARPKPDAVRPTVARPEKPAPPRVPAEIALPAHRNSTPQARTSGVVLTGDARLGCVWLLVGGKRIAALWPPGYRARFGPVRVYDERHREVWRAGQVRDIGGGVGQWWRGESPVPAACRTGDDVYFFAGIDPGSG